MPRDRRRDRRRRAALHRRAHHRRRRAHHPARLRRRGRRRPGRAAREHAVERYREAGLLGRGIAFFLGRALLARRQHGAGRRRAPRVRARDRPRRGRPRRPTPRATPCEPHTRRRSRASTRRATSAKPSRRASPPAPTPHKYVIVATGNIYDDAVQAKAAAAAGADIVAVIRATAQSLLDYVPHGATTEGYGGTFATQENFKIIRRAVDEASEECGRYIQQTNYSSGLCMAEIAWMAAVERLDMLLNDAMYGILFRDINMCRTFVDQYVSRRFIARARHRHQHRRGQLPDDGRRRGEGAHGARRASSSTRPSRCAPACGEEQMGLGPRLRDRPVARGLVPARDRAGAAGPADLRPPPHQVDAADQAQDGRHLLRPRARRDVRPRRRHHEAVDRAARHVQRGDPQPAAHGPVPGPQGDALRLRRREAPRRRDRVQEGRHRRHAAPCRCSTRRSSCSRR